MMKLVLITKLVFGLFLPFICLSQINDAPYPTYAGKDLGVSYSAKNTVFKVWAPTASAVKLNFYAAGIGGKPTDTVLLNKTQNGVWKTNITHDIKNTYYTFQIKYNGQWLTETPDIYAKAVGVNGKRGMVINWAETNPINWQNDKKPPLKNFTDIIIYESHMRDFSVSNNGGIKNKGKFLSLTETGTKNLASQFTGLDHLKELGITHIHLLPSFDFNSIDETKPNSKDYNWGYDPLNYNVPEGSYSTDPMDGKVRIKEFKQMVQTLHKNGVRIILDVVYNHTANPKTPFNLTVPDYFYRLKPDGSYSDATGCGNETASEKAMMRKFMVESVAFWATAYHLDGFRFDLMGVHDIETMNEISDTLHKIDPTIFIYGEGWTAGESTLPENLRAVKKNTNQLNKIAAFSDDLRDAVRGPFNNVKEKGFVSAATGLAESIKFGIVAATQHPQIDYSAVNHSQAPWASEPYQAINYTACHDDNTMYDRLVIENPEASEADLIKMDRLGQSIVLTSQGVPFLQSGAEMLRTKQGIANSYNSPDSINEIDWSRKTRYNGVFLYYKALIALRKHHAAFRMPDAKMIQSHLQFLDTQDPLLVAYQINNHANADKWKNILVLLNGNKTSKVIKLPAGKWTLVADGNVINENGLKEMVSEATIPATSAFIFYKMD